MPSRTPRVPIIGFTSCQLRAAFSSFALVLVELAARFLVEQLGDLRQELVQRRVEQADGDGQAVHRLEDADEVFLLLDEQRVERVAPLRARSRRG